MAGVYVHIPFCIKKCYYCSFYSTALETTIREPFLKALIREIQHAEFTSEVQTIYFGGGTPTLLTEKEIEQILHAIQKKFTLSSEVEITIEANPETVTEHLVHSLHSIGINRVSLGVQSLIDKELSVLGRIHNSQKAKEAIELIAEVFDNFSVDIIFNIPGQSIHDLETTLLGIVEFSPPHLSAYELTIEPETPLSELVEDTGREEDRLYWCVISILTSAGYEHYEISNYAKEGFRCRHNMNYWLRKEYIGFGPSAASLVNNCRYSNVADVNGYIQMIHSTGCATAELQVLGRDDVVEETIMLGLRTSEGIDMSYVSNLDLLFEFQKKGLLRLQDNRIVLTDRGMLLSNRVILELIMQREQNQ